MSPSSGQIVLLIVVMFTAAAFAGNRSNFLSHGPSTEALGRGETGTAFSDDFSMTYYNPSLLANLKNTSISFNYHNLFDNTRYSYAGFSLPLDSLSLGVSMINLRSGDIEIREKLTDTPSLSQTNQWLYAVSLAKNISHLSNLNIGMDIKFVYLDLHDRQNGSFGADLGFSRTFKGPELFGNESVINTGFAAQNIIPPEITLISYEESYNPVYRLGGTLSLPVIYRFLSYDVLSLYEDIVFEEKTVDPHTGIEYAFMNRYFLRLGYYKNHYTAGIGFHSDSILFNYSIDFNDLAQFNRFGISYSFDNNQKRTETNTGKKSTKNSDLSLLMKEARSTLREMKRQKNKTNRVVKPLFLTAKRYYSKKQYLRASDKFREIILQYPEYEMAQLYYRKINNEMNVAAHLLNESNFQHVFYAKAYVSYYEQNYNNAINEWKKVLQLDPDRSELNEYIAVTNEYLRNAERRKKEKEIENTVSGMFNDALQDFADKKWITTIKKLERVQGICQRESFPGSLEWFHKAQEHIAKSVKELSKVAYKHEPDKPSLIDKSVETEIDAAGSDKKYTEGLVLYAQGKLSEAIRVWDIALRLKPNNEKALKALNKSKEELETSKK